MRMMRIVMHIVYDWLIWLIDTCFFLHFERNAFDAFSTQDALDSKGLGALHRRVLQRDTLRLTMLLHQEAEASGHNHNDTTTAKGTQKRWNHGRLSLQLDFKVQFWLKKVLWICLFHAYFSFRGEPSQSANGGKTVFDTSWASSVLRRWWGQLTPDLVRHVSEWRWFVRDLIECERCLLALDTQQMARKQLCCLVPSCWNLGQHHP